MNKTIALLTAMFLLAAANLPAEKREIDELDHECTSWMILSDLTGILLANGWESAGKEAGTPSASGDVFVRGDASEILLIGINPGQDKSTSNGTLYLRKLK